VRRGQRELAIALFAAWPSTPPPGYAQRDRELALASAHR